MKLAIISDVHGNSFALDRVLVAIANDGIEQIVCLGDLALQGFDPVGSIRRIAELGIPTVRGNTDDMILNGLPNNPDAEGLLAVRNDWYRWQESVIGESERAFLATLPASLEVEIEGVSLFAYHGSPKSYNDPVLPGTPIETIEEYFAGIDAPLLAGGHTHNLMLRRWGGRSIINPGTVGLPFFRLAISARPSVSWAEFAVISVDGGKIDITFRYVPIEHEEIAKAVHASGIPDPDVWLEGWAPGWPV